MANVKSKFEACPWHDARLRLLSIDRTQAGARDEVALDVEWPDGRRQIVTFRDCYAFHGQMNFGVVADESILRAECFEHTPAIAEITDRWRKAGVDITDLYCFEVETNSTSSLIRVFARGFAVRS